MVPTLTELSTLKSPYWKNRPVTVRPALAVNVPPYDESISIEATVTLLVMATLPLDPPSSGLKSAVSDDPGTPVGLQFVLVLQAVVDPTHKKVEGVKRSSSDSSWSRTPGRLPDRAGCFLAKRPKSKLRSVMAQPPRKRKERRALRVQRDQEI